MCSSDLGPFLTGLKFSPGFGNKSSQNQIADYMERDSARGTIQPGTKILARYFQTRLGFSARPNGPENLTTSHVIETEFQPGLKSEVGHAHQETRWLQVVRSKSDFSGIKETK